MVARAYGDTLLEGPPEEVRVRVLGILERETHRVGDIVSDFLDFARPEPPSGIVLHLQKVIEEVRSSWEMDPRTAGLPLSIDPIPAAHLRSDPTGLHRALMNLLSNARKAVKDRPDPLVRLSAQASEATICLTILDNGCGMEADQLERLFVPFAGSFEEGSGLGMSLVYKFIEAMDWRIDVESAVGSGTTIRIFLPMHKDEPVASPSDQA